MTGSVHGQVAFVAAQNFFQLQIQLRKKFPSLVRSLKTNDCATQRAFSIFPKDIFFKICRSLIWKFACAMWNLLGKQCDGPEDPVCHADLTFLPPDGSFGSFESRKRTFDFSVKTQEGRVLHSFSETLKGVSLISKAWGKRSSNFWSSPKNWLSRDDSFILLC